MKIFHPRKDESCRYISFDTSFFRMYWYLLYVRLKDLSYCILQGDRNYHEFFFEKRRDRETRRERERDRDRDNGSQIGSRNRSTISGNDNIITNKEEDSVASRTRNKRKRKHNKTIRRILTDQQQEDHVHWQRTSTEDDENNSYEY